MISRPWCRSECLEIPGCWRMIKNNVSSLCICLNWRIDRLLSFDWSSEQHQCHDVKTRQRAHSGDLLKLTNMSTWPPEKPVSEVSIERQSDPEISTDTNIAGLLEWASLGDLVWTNPAEWIKYNYCVADQIMTHHIIELRDSFNTSIINRGIGLVGTDNYARLTCCNLNHPEHAFSFVVCLVLNKFEFYITEQILKQSPRSWWWPLYSSHHFELMRQV